MATMTSSYIHSVDLLLASKSDILEYLDHKAIMSGHTSCTKRFSLKTRLHLFISVFIVFVISVSHPSEAVTCGETNPNYNFIDFSEPLTPGPFHDLTTRELQELRVFLESDPDIRAVDPAMATMTSSFIHSVDLLLASKSDILEYLDHNGPLPHRRARVVMIRGDKTPPVVEEYVCGPLPYIQRCDLLDFASRRNPVEFSFRPSSSPEFAALRQYVLPEVDQRFPGSELEKIWNALALLVGHILRESYGATFTQCEDPDCFQTLPSQLGSGITRDPHKRLIWLTALYNLPFWTTHALDFAILIDITSSDATRWSVTKIWYADQLFESFDDLIIKYETGSVRRRGEPLPSNPQRPPTLVEPDGKRYSIKDRQVTYLGWEFNFRSSSLHGPAVYDVRFKGERIAFEIALSEIIVWYNAHQPAVQTSDFVDSILGNLGQSSRGLVPGADCPESATFIDNIFMSTDTQNVEVSKAGFCLFENNNGSPLRRRSSYFIFNGSFYGGLLDSYLTLRSILTLGNYDYVVDYNFHQNGVIDVRLLSTGYIITTFYSELERPYGFHLQDYITGPLHHHQSIFKVDLDVGGPCNRYETLDISQERVSLTAFPGVPFYQTRFCADLKRTELEAVFDYDFEKPRYHVVHNAAKKTNFNELKGYRIQMDGMSKSLLPEGQGNEPSISWARHQMVVTRHKDDEISASSVYAGYDSYNPVVNFTSYYSDNENIVDQDLVFWVTNGMYHIPHTEDLPLTPTSGNQQIFYLLPFNYFPEDPSVGSRDIIYVELKDPNKPELGVRVERNGNNRTQCEIPRSRFEENVETDPERVLQIRP